MIINVVVFGVVDYNKIREKWRFLIIIIINCLSRVINFFLLFWLVVLGLLLFLLVIIVDLELFWLFFLLLVVICLLDWFIK